MSSGAHIVEAYANVADLDHPHSCISGRAGRRSWFFAGSVPLGYARAAPPDSKKRNAARDSNRGDVSKIVLGRTDEVVIDLDTIGNCPDPVGVVIDAWMRRRAA